MLGSVREQVHRERWKPRAPGRKEHAVGRGRGRQGNLAKRRGDQKDSRGRIDHRNGEGTEGENIEINGGGDGTTEFAKD